MSKTGAARRAAVPTSNARAEASRRNGAKSRGPKTPEGMARSARNALKHGLRAQKYVVLPEEDAGEFEALEAALLEELAPASALQIVLARRVAIAAWRLMRADRMEVEVLDFRRGTPDNIGLAVIRDGNGTRSLETLLRYRGAATAELMRALRTLKALQAEQATDNGPKLRVPPKRAATPLPLAHRPQPNQPERAAEARLDDALPERPSPAHSLHEPATSWTPNEPSQRAASPRAQLTITPNQTEPARPQHQHPPGPTSRRTNPNLPGPRAPTTGNSRPRPPSNRRHGFPGSHGPSKQMPNSWLTIG